MLREDGGTEDSAKAKMTEFANYRTFNYLELIYSPFESDSLSVPMSDQPSL